MDLGAAQEGRGGFIGCLLQHPLPTLVLPRTLGRSTLGGGCIRTCALDDETPLHLPSTLPYAFPVESEAGTVVGHQWAKLCQLTVLPLGHVPPGVCARGGQHRTGESECQVL